MSDHRVMPPPASGPPRRYPRVGDLVIGLGGVALGIVLGFLIGANIGGNWMTGISMGSLHGYEATAAVGAVVGGVALGVLAFWSASRRRR